MSRRATLVIDRDRCEGHGQCAFAAPELVRISDTGETVIVLSDVTDHLETALKAVKACLAIALKIE